MPLQPPPSSTGADADQVRAVKALADSERRYRALFERAPLPMWLWDVATRAIVDVNDAAVETYGYRRQEFIGMDVARLAAPDEMARVEQELAAASSGRSLHRVQRHRRCDGRVLEVELSAHEIVLDERKFRIVTARDVTAERAAAEMRARLAALVDASPEAIIGQDLEGKVVTWNPAAERLFGWRADEIIGRPVDLLVADDERPEYDELRERVLRERRAIECEATRRHRDERELQVYLSLAPVLGADGAAIGVVAMARDITQDKLLRRQLQQAQKMEAVGQLAGGIAHDFNNLLTAIRGYSEMALADIPADNPARDDVREVIASTDRAASLTHQLLAFSRKQLLQPDLLDPAIVVSDMEGLLGRLIGEHIEMVLHIAEPIGTIRADRGQLEQVLVNLAVNARDAMPEAGVLLIRVVRTHLTEAFTSTHPGSVPGAYVAISVSDTGVGMSAEVRERIFEPFFTTKATGKGSGLGMSMVYGIVKQSGGYVDVESAEGNGTTVVVYLPIVADEPHPTPRHTPIVAFMPRTTRGETVLVVEDAVAVRSVVRRALEGAGYTVIEAVDGANALAIFRERGGLIDLMITDLVMPRLGGRGLTEELQQLGARIPVLVMSGYSSDPFRAGGGPFPDMDFIEKPFTTAAVVQKVRRLLDASRSRRRAQSSGASSGEKA
ncbi:MAG TPA: PAS domain S-box protein [Gemmatimonadaceae bacterium]